jgi:hypothetical protein
LTAKPVASSRRLRSALGHQSGGSKRPEVRWSGSVFAVLQEGLCRSGGSCQDVDEECWNFRVQGGAGSTENTVAPENSPESSQGVGPPMVPAHLTLCRISPPCSHAAVLNRGTAVSLLSLVSRRHHRLSGQVPLPMAFSLDDDIATWNHWRQKAPPPTQVQSQTAHHVPCFSYFGAQKTG